MAFFIHFLSVPYGDKVLLTVLIASASYIAVPASMNCYPGGKSSALYPNGAGDYSPEHHGGNSPVCINNCVDLKIGPSFCLTLWYEETTASIFFA